MYEFIERDTTAGGINIENKVRDAMQDMRDRGDDNDVRSNREVRNEEIPPNKSINENIQNKNKSNEITSKTITSNDTPSNDSMIFYIMSWVSNTVMLMLFSTVITLVVTKNSKWFYILLSVFIIVTLVQIFKIILMRYNAPFLYRPGNCTGSDSITDIFLYKNFIIENILKRINRKEYHKRGFPSIHMTIAASMMIMVYLFFPKFRKVTLNTAPIYLILLGYSRIYLNCHTFLQVMAGIIAGILGGNVMYNIFR